MFNVPKVMKLLTAHEQYKWKLRQLEAVKKHHKTKIVARYEALSTAQFVKFNWLCKKSNGHLICDLWSTSPFESRENDSFVKGQSGTANGYKLENFTRHEQRTYHEEALGRMLSQAVKWQWTIFCGCTGIERSYRVPFSWQTSKQL